MAEILSAAKYPHPITVTGDLNLYTQVDTIGDYLEKGDELRPEGFIGQTRKVLIFDIIIIILFPIEIFKKPDSVSMMDQMMELLLENEKLSQKLKKAWNEASKG